MSSYLRWVTALLEIAKVKSNLPKRAALIDSDVAFEQDGIERTFLQVRLGRLGGGDLRGGRVSAQGLATRAL